MHWPFLAQGRGELGSDLWRVLQSFQKDFPVPARERDDLMLADCHSGLLDQSGDHIIRQRHAFEIGRS